MAYTYTYLERVKLDKYYSSEHYHSDGIYHICGSDPSWLQVDHGVIDEYATNTTVPYSSQFFSTCCTRRTELHDYTYYGNNCVSSTSSTSSDSGLQCTDTIFGPLLTLVMVGGFVRGSLGNLSCSSSCPNPPASGFFTEEPETSLTIILDCQGSYVGKLLQLQLSLSIMSETPPTGEEFLINGIAPSHIYQSNLSQDYYGLWIWGGTLYWDMPINVRCGEKIILTPSDVKGWGRGGLDYIKVPLLIGIEIIKPVNNDDFDLTQTNHTETQPINYNAYVEPVGGASTVDWNVAITYRTSGGKCEGCDVTRTFQSAPDVDHPETYASMGGQATVNASAVIQGETITAIPVTHTITGVAIPDAEITNRLVSLYTGPSKGLMAGLAMKESSYMQFSNRLLYGRTDRWPREDYVDGTFIGLMMVKTTMQRAWDWLNNTDYGVKFFSGEKWTMAKNLETAIKNDARTKYKCQLRNLTEVERENMTLVLYGEKAMNSLTGQYYYYQTTTNKGKTTCDWIENTQGNPAGVDYAKAVRTFCNQKVPGSC